MKRTKCKIPTEQQGYQRPKASRRAPAKKANAPLSARLRQRAEERLRRQRRDRKPGAGGQVAGADTERVVHELRVHQIELEMQNEELLRARHELEVSREKYFDLYDLAPVGYLTLNEKGRILEVNLTAARLLGVARTDLVRQPLTRFILREDLGIFNQHRQQLFGTRAPQNCELRLRRPGGTPIWVRVEAILAQDHGTAAPVCRMALSDLTERKQAEAAREGFAQFERMAQLMKCASDSILLTNEHGRILEANDRALETYGYSLTELRQKTVEDLRTPESRAELPRQTEQLETDGRAVFEATHQRRDGFAFPVEISARFLQIAGVRCRLGILRDITARKQVEVALRDSETRFRELFSHMSSGVAVYEARNDGQDFVFKDFNRAAERIEATPREAVLGRSVVEVFPGVKEFGLFNVLQRVWRTGQPEHPPTWIYRDNHIVGWRDNYVYKLPNGEIVAVYDDVTERKQAEAVLRASEERYRTLFEAMDEGFCIIEMLYDPEGKPVDYRFVEINPAFEKHTGLQQALGKTIRQMVPNHEVQWFEIYGKVVRTGEAIRFEKPAKAMGRHYDVFAFRMGGEGSQRVGVLFNDITERKRVGEALLESEVRYRSLFDNLVEGFAYCRMLFEDGRPQDFIYVEVNEAFQTLTGLKNVTGRKVSEVIPGLRESDPELLERYGRVALTGQPERFETYIAALKMWFSISAYCPKKEHFVAVFDVITERKQVEEALRKSERLQRTILNNIPDPAWMKDVGGCFVEVNEAWCRFAGTTREQVIGRSELEFFPPSTAAQFREHDRAVVRAGHLLHLEESVPDGSGGLRRFETFKTPLIDPAGNVSGTIGISRDITERKRAEQRVQMFSQEIIAAREEERKQVSSVLHHDVGSLAVGISAHLDAIEQDLRAGKPREALQWMKRTRKLFGESVVRLKGLAVELRPPELDVLGLCAALRQHFAQVTERVGIRIHFRETLGRKRVPEDTATILFRAAQEALTNAITHGQATRVDVDLRASKEEVTLRVRDNGKGFDPSELTAQATSQMGLRVMHEMATAAGGVFTVDSGRGKGTTVRVRLPIADLGLRNADFGLAEIPQ